MATAIQIKICGVTNANDARACVELGADMIGFNFYRRARATSSPLWSAELWTRSQQGHAPSAFSSMQIQQKFASSPKLPAFDAFNCMDIQRLNRAANWLENFA